MLNLNDAKLARAPKVSECDSCHTPIQVGDEVYTDYKVQAHRTCCQPFKDLLMSDPVLVMEVRWKLVTVKAGLGRDWAKHSEVKLHEGPLMASFTPVGERINKRIQQGFVMKWEAEPLEPPALGMLWGTDGLGNRSCIIWFRQEATPEPKPSKPVGFARPGPVEPNGFQDCLNCGNVFWSARPHKGFNCHCPIDPEIASWFEELWTAQEAKRNYDPFADDSCKPSCQEHHHNGKGRPLEKENTPSPRATPREIYEQRLRGLQPRREPPKFQPVRDPTLGEMARQAPAATSYSDKPGVGISSSRGTTNSGQEFPKRGTYTVAFPSWHKTFRIEEPDPTRRFAPEKTIISLLVGSDNESDYKSFGFIEAEPGGPVGLRAWDKTKHLLSEQVLRAVEVLLQNPAAAGEAFALRSGRCYRCSRKLTVPASIHRGLGPECATKV